VEVDQTESEETMKTRKALWLVTGGALVATFGAVGLTRAQWVRLNGPYTDQVFSLSAGPQGLFAAVMSGVEGIMRSVDGGFTWQGVSNGLESGVEQCRVAALPSGVFASISYQSTGYLYKLDLPSETWFQIGTLVLPGDFINAFGQVGDVILCGTSGGLIYRSRDGGLHWEKSGPIHPVQCFAWVGRSLLAGTWGGSVYASSDTGKAWEWIGNPDVNVYVTSMVALGGKAYVAYEGNVIYTYDPEYRAWAKLSTLPWETGGGILATNGAGIYYATPYYGVFFSADSGKTWEHRGLSDVPIRDLVCYDGGLVAGTAGLGLFASRDAGLTWRQTGLLPHSSVEAILVVGSSVFCGTEEEGILVSRDAGETFTEYTGLSHSRLECFHRRGSDLFAGTGPAWQHGGGIWKSTDGGSTWSRLGLMDRYVSCIEHVGDWLFAGSPYPGGLFRTSNEGLTWQSVSNGFPAADPPVDALAAVGTVIFVAPRGAPFGVYRSDDYGNRWTHYGLADTGVTSLVAVDSQLFAATAYGVFVGSPSQPGWKNVALRDTLVTQLVYGNGVLIAVTEWDLFASEDGGLSWRRVNRDGLPEDCALRCVAMEGEWIYLGTAWQGLWKRRLSEIRTSVGNSAIGQPSSPRLEPNFPNPFNPTTTIVIDLPRRGRVSLTVLDMLGRTVATLASGEMEAGRHSLRWDASAHPAGVYFCRLVLQSAAGEKAPSFVETRKMVYLK
jgi:photosystem II stability/assembly factor-like uncharacterized protein